MRMRFGAGAAGCFLMAISMTSIAQQPWQKMQMPTAAEVAKIWKTPPSEYGPEPYFGMNGAVTMESLSQDLDRMKSLGFHAVTVQAGRGMTQPYLSPEYFAFFKQFVEAAKKRDMRVWIVDDIGYPSGFAGGKFTSERPELRMQALAITQHLPVKAGEILQQAVGQSVVSALAVGSTGEKVAVPLTSGKIDWTAPSTGGDWTVILIEHLFRTSPTRSDTNPKRTKDMSQSLEDYMDPVATAAYIQFTHEQYYKAMPEEFGKTILGFRGDEPDYTISGLPWTPKFFDTFQRVKGYDIRPYVAAILMVQENAGEKPVKLTETELRAKADYYDVFSQMFQDGFFKPQGVWCAAHGVEYQVHLNHEEMEMELTQSEGDFMRDMKYVEVPGIDAIWHQIWTDTISDFPRLAASAAHLYGRPRAFTETFAAYRPAPDITMARYILNEQLVRGVNLFETMYYPSSGAEGRGGPSAVMRDPDWPALMEYVRRMSYVMSMGKPSATVALYLPSDSMWLDDTDADTAFVSTERLLSERQVDFDVVGIDALTSDLKAGPGTLETMSGNQYKTVILPSLSALPQTALDRLKAFAQGGGKVLFLGRTPRLIWSKTILDAHVATEADFSWATVENTAELPPTPTPPAQPPTTAPTPQVVPAALEKALDRVLGMREVMLDSPDASLRVLTRQLKDAGVYLFFNEGSQDSSHEVTIQTHGHKVEEWNPATGVISTVKAKTSKDSITVKLDLKSHETKLLMVR